MLIYSLAFTSLRHQSRSRCRCLRYDASLELFRAKLTLCSPHKPSWTQPRDRSLASSRVCSGKLALVACGEPCPSFEYVNSEPSAAGSHFSRGTKTTKDNRADVESEDTEEVFSCGDLYRSFLFLSFFRWGRSNQTTTTKGQQAILTSDKSYSLRRRCLISQERKSRILRHRIKAHRWRSG